MTKNIIQAIIYSKDYCPYCDLAKDILERFKDNVSVQTKDISASTEFMNEMKDRFDSLKISIPKTVPQIFINDIYVGGYDDLSKVVLEDDWLKKYF